MSKPYKFSLWQLIFLCLLMTGAAYFIWSHWPEKHLLQISIETTCLTSPVNTDGTIDFIEYFNSLAPTGYDTKGNVLYALCKILGWDFFQDADTGNIPAHLSLEQKGIFIPYKTVIDDIFAGQEQITVQGKTFTKQAALKAMDNWSLPDIVEDDNYFISAYLEQNQTCLDLLYQVGGCTYLYIPWLHTDKKPELLNQPLSVNVIALIDFTKFLVMDACHKIYNKKNFKSSWNNILILLKVIRMFNAYSTGGSILFMTSLAMELHIYIFLEYILSNNALPLVDVQTLLSDLLTLRDLPQTIRNMLVHEHFTLIDIMSHFSAIDPDSEATQMAKLSYFDINLALKRINNFYDSLLKGLELRSYRKQVDYFKGIFHTLQKSNEQDAFFKLFLAKIFGKPAIPGIINWITDRLLFGTIALTNNQEKLDTIHMRLILIKTGLILKAYCMKNGKFPSSLDVLVPVQLSEIPEDYFSGSPILYRKDAEGIALMSAGKNSTFDAGSKTDDIIIHVR